MLHFSNICSLLFWPGDKSVTYIPHVLALCEVSSLNCKMPGLRPLAMPAAGIPYMSKRLIASYVLDWIIIMQVLLCESSTRTG